jgi:ribosomal protein L15E
MDLLLLAGTHPYRASFEQADRARTARGRRFARTARAAQPSRSDRTRRLIPRLVDAFGFS